MRIVYGMRQDATVGRERSETCDDGRGPNWVPSSILQLLQQEIKWAEWQRGLRRVCVRFLNFCATEEEEARQRFCSSLRARDLKTIARARATTLFISDQVMSILYMLHVQCYW